MKLNDMEIKKAKTWLIITLILGLSIGFVSALLESYIGIVVCIFIFTISTYYFVILCQQLPYTKSKQQVKL